ncbi:hypothetical protein HWV07_09705 [Natronomonas salina]|uniref:DUF6230 family protein n=1 Tax=Natronomonas salina TaxID=1710540 RepID=UPI0015B4C112|nr:DUF6230 family protein [Natronomonas salina]QLD89287.1 hypothetical protein HWV07_09705 [Natronomonas salina]
MYNKRILAAGLAASIGALALIGVLLAASGVAYAVPLAGVGGFTVEADEIRGESMYMYPGVEETSESDAQPVAVTEMQSTEIDGLTLTKEMDASPMPGLDGTMRVVISQGGNETVETGQQMLKFTSLQAEESQFSGQVVNEHNSDNPSDQFDIAAPGDAQDGKTVNISGSEPGLVLKNAEIQAHYLAVSSISIPDIQINVEYDEGASPSESDSSGASTTEQNSEDNDSQEDQQVVEAGDRDGEKNKAMAAAS